MAPAVWEQQVQQVLRGEGGPHSFGVLSGVTNILGFLPGVIIDADTFECARSVFPI